MMGRIGRGSIVTLAVLAFAGVSGCNQKAPSTQEAGPAMPAPTVTGSVTPAPEGAEAASLTLISAKLRVPTGDRPTAGYLGIANEGPAAETLTGITSPDFGRIEMHEMVTEGSMMTMKKMDSLTIAAGQTVTFEPGGKHLMLFDAKRALKNGDQVKITLTFSQSGPIEANFVALSEIPHRTDSDDDSPNGGHDAEHGDGHGDGH